MNKVRQANKEEIADLINYLHLEAIHDLTTDEVEAYVKEATIAVFPYYCSETPGYTGRLMTVIWSYPEMYELYQWDNEGMIARVKQDKALQEIE